MLKNPSMLRNHGRIKRLELPGTWEIVEDYQPSNASPSWKTFAPNPANGAELTVYFRGRPLTRATQTVLKQILDRDSKQLNTKQLESISEVLREASLSDAFKFLNAGVQNWNGKKVLIVEGRWNELVQDRYWMFVPSDSECEAVEEIWFQAPVATYPAQLRLARQALASIEWSD